MIDDYLRDAVGRGFYIYGSEVRSASFVFSVKPRYSNNKSFSRVMESLAHTQYMPLYRKVKGELQVHLVKRLEKERGIKPKVHLGLMAATILTATWAGYRWFAEGDIMGSILFAVALMAILGIHETGHALMARARGIKATLPFFIPAPPIFPLGTFGAIIFINSPFPNRRTLIEVGIAGPLLGFLLSLPVIFIGLSYSTIVTMASQEPQELIFYMPLIFSIINNFILGPLPPGHVIEPHPITMAGWAGLFVTSLNLLPMGQLDGGHIVRGIFTRHFRKVYFLIAGGLVFLGVFPLLYSMVFLPEGSWVTGWLGWVFWVILTYLLTRFDHPGPLDDVSGLDLRTKALAILGLIILVLTFIPFPVWVVPG